MKHPTKAPRVTKTEEQVINKQAVGDEPTWTKGEVPSYTKKAEAFAFYAVMGTPDAAREYLTGWFASRNEHDTVAGLNAVPDSCFPRTPSWLARMEQLGADVSASEPFIRTSAAEAIKNYGKKPEKVVKLVTPTEIKLANLIADVEEVVDKRDWSYSVYDALKTTQFPVSRVSAVVDYYYPLLEEIKTAIANTDPQIHEAYRKYAKADLRKQVAWLEKLVDDCKRYGQVERKYTAPKKKPQSMEKKLKKVDWLRESVKHRVKSLDPSIIVGAKRVYLYNIKYEAVTVLEGESLDIKGKSVIGHSDKSRTVATGSRIADKVIASIVSGNKAGVERGFEELAKGKRLWPRAKNLIDGNTMVLRAFKE